MISRRKVEYTCLCKFFVCVLLLLVLLLMLILLFRYCHYFCFVFTVISSFVFIDITTALDLVYAKNESKGDLTVEK
mgnify:CR=1 FL=1